jgi:hypothetical protein
MSGEHSDQSRRAFLKSTGFAVSGLATLSSAGWVSGKKGKAPTRGPQGRGCTDGIPQGAYNAVLQKRKRKGWSTNKWRKELAKRGAGFSYMDSRVQVSHPVEREDATLESVKEPTVTVERMKPIDKRKDDSEVGINHLHDDNVKLELTYISGYYDTNYQYHPPHIDFSWSVKDPWTTSVQQPVDFATISIDPDQYNWGRGMDYGPWASATEAIDSMGFAYRNARYNAWDHSDRTIGWFGSYMNAPLEPISGSPSSRKIYIDYVARWEETEITGMSVSTGGDVSISFGTSTGMWRAEASAKESEMDNGDSYIDDVPV